MTQRFKDDGRSLYHFSDNFLVKCPRCEKKAETFRLESDSKQDSHIRAARVICANCGYSKDQQIKQITTGAAVDSFFNLPLWLQTPCCGEVLWSYNEAHLDFLEEFVEAKIRETDIAARKQAGVAANVNRTLASKLPRWLKSAKNREEILKCIEKLRKTLE